MNLRFTVITILAIATIGCAFLGHLEAGRNATSGAGQTVGEGWLYVNAVASTMSIFPRGAGVAVNSPVLLQTARVLALLTAALAAIEIWRHYFYRAASRLCLKIWRGHTLICGFGRKGRRLAAVLGKETKKCAVIEKNSDQATLNLCQRLGVSLLDGDPSDVIIMKMAGVKRAATVFVVCGRDQTNIEIAMQILASYRKAGAKQPFQCHVHVVRLALLELLQRQTWLENEVGGFELRFFNIHQNAARLLFFDHPLEGDSSAFDPDRQFDVHLIIMGFKDLGEAILLQAAAIGHFPGNKKLKVTVVCSNSTAREKDFLSRQPHIGTIIDLEFAECPPIERTNPLGNSFPDESAQARTIVVVALEDDAENVTSALRVANWRGDRNIPVLVQIAEQEGLASLVATNENRLAEQNIATFGAIEQVFGPEMLLGVPLDKIARAIHESYLRNYPPAPGAPLSPSQKPWDQLPEDFKQANRAQADHIEVKLHVIGCERVSGNSNAGFSFTEDEVETLAIMEHKRWIADRLLAGWVYADETDKTKKYHASLVPWEKLQDAEKQKDRDAVLAIPELLAEAGCMIRRRTG